MAIRKLNLKDKLDGEELDLSLLTLTEIPVSDIAAIPKATKIDLSNNALVSMPQSFAKSLPHITKLELGCNKLKELPSNFGNLTNLKHLDLYNNQLTDLPVSLSKLINLRYLDLKGNPLNPQLAKEAGNCINNKECQVAAKRVLAYLNKIKMERNHQENLKMLKEKEKDSARLRREEEEQAKKKAEKKAAKDKRRTELEIKATAISQNGAVAQNGKPQKKKEVAKKSNVKESKPVKKAPKGWSFLAIVNMFMLVGALFAVGTCVALYVEGDLSVQGLQAAWPRVKHNSALLFNMTREALSQENIQSTTKAAWKTMQPYVSKAQDVLTIGFHTTKNMTSRAFSSVQAVTGDLSPYIQGLKPLWNNFIKSVLWFVRLIVDAVQMVNWSYLIDGVRWTIQFFVEQFLVLKEELCRNKVIVSIWKDLDPLRQSLWDNTLTVRQTFYRIYHEVEISWYPLIKEQSDHIFNYIKESLGVMPN